MIWILVVGLLAVLTIVKVGPGLSPTLYCAAYRNFLETLKGVEVGDWETVWKRVIVGDAVKEGRILPTRMVWNILDPNYELRRPPFPWLLRLELESAERAKPWRSRRIQRDLFRAVGLERALSRCSNCGCSGRFQTRRKDVLCKNCGHLLWVRELPTIFAGAEEKSFWSGSRP